MTVERDKDEEDGSENVVSLDEMKTRRLERDFENGAAFKFIPYEHSDDRVGLIEAGIVFLTQPDDLTGIVLDPEDAERLGVELIQAAGVYRSQTNEHGED